MTSRVFTLPLVEDEQADADLFQEVGRTEWPELAVQHVEHGVQALTYLQHSAAGQSDHPWPSLILLDLQLPAMSGLELLTAIKEHPMFRSIPVLIFSTWSETEDIRQAYASSVSGYLVKPQTVESLSSLMRAVRDYWTRVQVAEPSTLGERGFR